MAAAVSEEVVPPPKAPTLPEEGSARSRSQTVLVACAISVAAGVIHAVAMVDHFGHYWLYGAFFLVVTYFQILWAVWIYRHPADQRVLTAGVVVNLAIVAVWIVSRSVGVPLGPDAGNPERLGAPDIVASLDQIVLASLILGLTSSGAVGRRMAWLAGAPAVRLGIMLCSASAFAMLLGSHHHH